MNVTDVFNANYNSTKQVVVNAGGTSSGKTYSILQVLLVRALETKNWITVVGETIPSLKSGALKDFQEIIETDESFSYFIKSYNATERKYTFTNGSVIEFRSFVSGDAAKAGKREYTFIDEINNVDKTIFEQLYYRTSKQVFLAYNPSAPFWVMTDLIGQPYVDFIRSWHEHNPFIPDNLRAKIEGIEDPELFKVYARGLPGKVEGLYFPRWTTLEAVPHEAQMIAVGLDFGFTNDPAAAIACYRYNGGVILDEVVYSTDLLIDDLADRLNSVKQYNMICDRAYPQMREELRKKGFKVESAVYPQDAIVTGIRLMQNTPLYVTARSSNLKRELMTYKPAKDKLGNPLNRPIDFMNHAIDAARYVFLTRLNRGTGKYSVI